MSDVIDPIVQPIDDEFDFEPCEDVHEVERGMIDEKDRDGTTLLKDVRSCPTASVAGLSRQIIDEMNLLVPNALVDFSDL
ncbi:MAG: hypothetical protein HC881_05130, partial [Leptolyngbyaceae cyanobacterium SL_7_1]|nr:hypothetical protein [Leptolyngbyaceae cyanobacterium SL_7_1]